VGTDNAKSYSTPSPPPPPPSQSPNRLTLNIGRHVNNMWKIVILGEENVIEKLVESFGNKLNLKLIATNTIVNTN
jgi:hypothetical protein